MKRPSSLPVLVQVGALAAAAVVASQAVAFAVVVLAPNPRPAGFSIAAAAEALQGRPARTGDGRVLRRRVTDKPVATRNSDDPMPGVIANLLAQQLETTPDAVRVSIDHRAMGTLRRRSPGSSQKITIERRPEDQSPVAMPRRPEGPPGIVAFESEEIEPDRRRLETFVTVLPGPQEGEPRRSGPPTGAVRGTFKMEHTLGIRTDRLSFGPFTASWRMADGRWATVEPPRSLLSPWQQRILIALALSALILAPLVWWMARRLTRPIRVFAEAAERLGADPEAEPLAPSGPTEVRTAISAFNDMQAAIRAHMRQRTQTIAAIAHDLRTPLTRLRFRAEQAPESVRERMASDIAEMDALIGQAMAFVRGDAATDRRERFDLDALAADCAAGFAETGADVTFDGGAPLAVDADPAALRRAIANLVDNALKFAGQARVRAFVLDGLALVEVDDDGPGLEEDELEAAFEPFHRGERSRNRETGGAGLGLSVARQAARVAHGEVRLINRPGGGLTARLTLPLAD